MSRPLFSVVTPSRNMLPYLRRAVRSVADQGQSVQHIVMDANSDDGTGEFLRAQPVADGRAKSATERVTEGVTESVIESDRGMYDALNKGFDRAKGDWFGHLNCDEQYLPESLSRVRAFTERHPDVDMVFGGCLLVRPDGELISYRKAYPPRWPLLVASHLYVMSCTMFFHRRLWDRGLRYDASLRDIADLKFVVDALRSGAKVRVLPSYTAAFTMTGSNMSAGKNAARELADYRKHFSPWLRAARLPLNAFRLLDKARHGAYRERFPLDYALYTADHPGRRSFHAHTATFRWRDR